MAVPRPQPVPALPPRFFARPWLPALALVAAVVLAYANTLHAPFLFDDGGAVTRNPTIRDLTSLAVLRPPADGSTTTGRPVVNLSFALNFAVSGENAGSYHALNLALHAAAALALLGIVRRTLRLPALSARWGASAPSVAFFTALLWALHPLQTESVSCIAQRTESLCGLFFLLTLYGFIRATGPTPHARRWFAVSFFACLLGMATKEVMVTAPLIVLLYDRTFLATTFAAGWRARRGYYAALAGTWFLLAGLVLLGGGARGTAAGFGLGVSGWNYLLKQSEAVVLYLKLSLWPYPLVLDYGTAVARSVADVWWQGPVVLGLLALTVWALVRKPLLGFAGAWFFVILAPSSSFVPLIAQTMAEHRLYLPLASLLVLAVLAAHRLLGARATALLAAVAVGGVALTAIRNHAYRDELTIWTDNITHHPSGARGHQILATVLQQRGRADEADAHFARAVALDPNYVSAHYGWGVALLDRGRIAEAIAQFETAVRLAPSHADAHLNLGNALLRAERPATAVAHYEAALRLKPAADAHYDLGLALIATGRAAEAAAHFQSALALNPALPEAHYQLARLADRAGDPASAESHYNETIRLLPDHADAQAHLGLLLARAERLPAAAAHLRTAVRLRPSDADALANLGNVLLLQGQPRDAIACYEASLRLRPDDPRTRENLTLAREALR